MKLSTRARYAVRCMIEFARRADGGHPTSLEKIANATQISRRYLEQLVIVLKGAALLRSVSGRKGGYCLAKAADQIRIGEIFEAAIGPINVVDCVRIPGTCLRAEWCECRLVYLLINERIREVLNEYSLADLSDTNSLRHMCRKLGADEASFFAPPQYGSCSGGCPIS
jgi:Rrf2 family protein